MILGETCPPLDEGICNTPLWYMSITKNVLTVKNTMTKEKMPTISKEKQKLLSRIRRLGGQMDAVQRSVTEGEECADILMLLAAIRGGVNSLMAEILEDHVRLHILHPERRFRESRIPVSLRIHKVLVQ